MDTLVMIAKEAVESSEPQYNSSEAQDQAPVALYTRGRKKPLQTMQLENQKLIGLLNHEACEMVHKPDTDNDALLFEIIVAELCLATRRELTSTGAPDNEGKERYDPE